MLLFCQWLRRSDIVIRPMSTEPAIHWRHLPAVAYSIKLLTIPIITDCCWPTGHSTYCFMSFSAQKLRRWWGAIVGLPINWLIDSWVTSSPGPADRPTLERRAVRSNTSREVQNTVSKIYRGIISNDVGLSNTGSSVVVHRHRTYSNHHCILFGWL